MRTSSADKDVKLIDDIDEEMMDDIDGEVENRLESKSKCSGEYLRKIEELKEARRLKGDLDEYNEWGFDDE